MDFSTLTWDAENQLWKNNSNRIVNEIFCDFDDIHLEGNAFNRYKIRHDATISNFQYTVVESKTDTLGGKYPFIRRNGDTYYRQFPIFGLITHFNENDYPEEYLAPFVRKYASNPNQEIIYDKHEFAEDGTLIPLKESLEKKRLQYVAQKDAENETKFNQYYYNENLNLNGYTDYLLEREYRDVVTNFFYENKIRLFRSPTEGNILVKLMNITLSPNEQIKRRVSAVQCTAYEVDTFNIEKCIEYGIWEDNKEIFTDILLSGATRVHIGQIRHKDEANLNSQSDGPYIRTNFYQEIQEDITKYIGIPFNLEKVIWLKSTYYGSTDYFGQLDDNMTTWAVLPNSPIIKELIVTTDNNPNNDDDIEIEIRNYDIDFPLTKLTTKFFDRAIGSKTSRNAEWAIVMQGLQKLAYLVVRYICGSSYQVEDKGYSWDDIKDWPEDIKQSFLAELKQKTLLELNTVLFTKDIDDHSVLKSRLAWTINAILENCPDLQSNVGSYVNTVAKNIEQGATLTDETLLMEMHRQFNILTINSQTNVNPSAEAIYSYSVDYGVIPFNGYWWNANTQPYELLSLEDDKNIWAKPFINFWICLALTMAICGDWGFGQASYDNLKDKTVADLTDGKAVLIDPNLTSNTLSTLKTGDISLTGYGMYVNNELIVVPPQGYYELTDLDTSVTQLSSQRLKETPLTCLIDYAALCQVYTEDDLLHTRKTVARYYKVGQVRGVESGIDIINMIKEKYRQDLNVTELSNAIKRTVVAVPYIWIEGEPRTKVFIKDSSDSEVELHILNDNGIITFYNKETNIEELFLEEYDSENFIIEDRNEIIYDNSHALNDVIINYICLIMETRY